MSIDDQIAKYLADPLNFPPEYKSWHGKYLETHQPSLQAGLLAGKLPTSKLTGQVPYSQLTLANSIVNADINTAAAIGIAKLAAYPASVAKVLAGDGTWPGGMGSLYNNLLGGTSGTIDSGAVLSTSYADLVIRLYLRGDTAANNVTCGMRFNNDTGTNYYNEVIDAVGAAVTSAEALGTTSVQCGVAPANTAAANRFSTHWILVSDYANATNKKSWVGLTVHPDLTTANGVTLRIVGGSWDLTPVAINRVMVFPVAGNFVAGSRLTVWGMGA